MFDALCDIEIEMKMKGKVHRTVVRPSLLYGEETWAGKKAQGKKSKVT